jgi:hypothetical protein
MKKKKKTDIKLVFKDADDEADYGCRGPLIIHYQNQ